MVRPPDLFGRVAFFESARPTDNDSGSQTPVRGDDNTMRQMHGQLET